jgi:hypothetical protein
MTSNEAVRARVDVAMAGQGSAIRVSDVLVIAIVRQVIDALGVGYPGDEEALPLPVRRMEEQLEASRELIVGQTARAAKRVEALDALADAARRYRKAMDRGKGRKVARAKLFDAVAASSASLASPPAPRLGSPPTPAPAPATAPKPAPEG